MSLSDFILKHNLGVYKIYGDIPKGYSVDNYIIDLKRVIKGETDVNRFEFCYEFEKLILKVPNRNILEQFYDKLSEDGVIYDVELFKTHYKYLVDSPYYSDDDKVRIEAIALAYTYRHHELKEEFEFMGGVNFPNLFLATKGDYLLHNFPVVFEHFEKQFRMYEIEVLENLSPNQQIDRLESRIKFFLKENIRTNQPLFEDNIKAFNQYINTVPSLKAIVEKRAERSLCKDGSGYRNTSERSNLYPHIFTNRGYELFEAFLKDKSDIKPTDYAFIFRALEKEGFVLDRKHGVYLEVLFNDFEVDLSKIHSYERVKTQERLRIYNDLKEL